ncbi:hypothetical protein SDC9_132927 [bioreactor metagenome]|uniref:Uncharacterized protein n=1 Tax=bioreactor metagenome TaxID=1076179 RepID=A0A645D950_9ZZZZ
MDKAIGSCMYAPFGRTLNGAVCLLRAGRLRQANDVGPADFERHDVLLREIEHFDLFHTRCLLNIISPLLVYRVLEIELFQRFCRVPPHGGHGCIGVSLCECLDNDGMFPQRLRLFGRS